MKVLLTLLFGLSLISAQALDLASVPDNNAEALKQAIEVEGGAVGGEPYLATEAGPDGNPVKLLVFPDPSCFVDLPVTPSVTNWAMTASVRFDELPFGKSGGPMFGLLFGRNDSVLAITADKWSKLNAPILISGATTLISEESFGASESIQRGDWRKIVLQLSGSEWRLKIGDSFNQSGAVENDNRNALGRTGTFFLRIGNFAGAATLPELTEAL